MIYDRFARLREGKSSHGGAASLPVTEGGRGESALVHRARPVGSALIMHDVSELRPLGFTVPVYTRSVLHNSSLVGLESNVPRRASRRKL